MRRVAVRALLLLGVMMAPDVYSADVTLTWDYPYTGAAGFALYCGDKSRNYTTRIDVGNTDIYRFTLPGVQVEFCAVAVYDQTGVESDLSNEVGVLVREPDQAAETLPPFSVRDGGWVLPTPTGVQVGFSLPVDTTLVNLYRGATAVESAADLTLVGAATGAVKGSLVVSADHMAVTFVKTSGLLAADTYTLTVAGRPDSVVDIFGRALDGDAHAGEDYRVAFAVPATGLPVLAISEFARAPGQAVNLPASDLGAGIPVTITKGGAVHEIAFSLRYDPALLSVEAANLGSAIIGTLSLAQVDALSGLVQVHITGISGLPDTSTVLLRIHARVPATAPYFGQHVLDLQGLTFNAGTLAGIDDDGLHVVGKLGDTSGEGFYSSFDAYLIQRLILRLDTGFSAFPTIDPVTIGDVNNNGWLDSNDPYLIQRKALRLPVPEIPD